MRNIAMSVVLVAASTVSQAFAVGPAIDATNHSQFNENAYYNGFGGPLPAGIVEGSAGFSTIGDYSGRTTALAAVTTNTVDNSTLTTINTGLFSGTDVNLYKIQVTNPATFSASVGSSSLILSLFNATGAGVASSVGTALSLANGVVTTPGQYYLAIQNPQQVAQNDAAQAIFTGQVALTAPAAGVYLPNLTNSGGINLSTTPALAFSLSAANTASNTLLTNTSFTAGQSTITLAGANFSVTPEPATLLASGSLAALAVMRRRRTA